MAGKHKPLQPHEVPGSFCGYIQWDTERKYSKSQGFLISVKCPMCDKLHWTKESAIRKGRCTSPKCQGCNARKPLTIDEVSDVWKPLILWDKKREKLKGKWAVWAKCPSCKEQRLLREVDLRIGRASSTGMCKSCGSSSRSGKNDSKWQGGRYKDSHGYIILNVNGLEGRGHEIAQQMMHSNKKTVREHRLIFAIHLNRPLTKKEIVHHKDGNKSNNKIENLELLTTRKHNSGHGGPYYQEWQESLSHIRKLEDKIIALGGDVKRFGCFPKAVIKCAFHAWLDWMMPNGQQHLAIDMGETEEERQATVERFWRVFTEMLLDVEEVD